MASQNPVIFRVYWFIYGRGFNGRSFGKCVLRRSSSRYLLRCSTLPLRSKYRRCVWYLWWLLFLVSSFYRVRVKPYLEKRALYFDDCRG